LHAKKHTDEKQKKGYIFHTMSTRLKLSLCRRQVETALLCAFFLVSCSKGAEELPLIPPTTDPLSRDFIGYGVVNASFIHVSSEPGQDSTSLGYLRKGSLVRIIERRAVTNRQNVELWLLVDTESQGSPEGKISGWLKEQDADIYDNEGRARTASETMMP
jgi:hypothetical protein